MDIICEHCHQRFAKIANLNKHIKNRTEDCLFREECFKKKLQLEIQKQAQQTIENGLTNIKARKKISANEHALQNNVPSFYKVIVDAEFTFDYLFAEVNRGRSGLANIFKQYYFTNLGRKKFCIKVYDIAREQYGVFNGTTWERVSLSHIVETFLKQIQPHIQNVIITQKIKEAKEIDSKHTPYFVALFDEPPDRAEHNQKIQALTDKYFYSSYLNGTLMYQEDEKFIRKMHFRIQNCVNTELA